MVFAGVLASVDETSSDGNMYGKVVDDMAEEFHGPIENGFGGKQWGSVTPRTPTTQIPLRSYRGLHLDGWNSNHCGYQHEKRRHNNCICSRAIKEEDVGAHSLDGFSVLVSHSKKHVKKGNVVYKFLNELIIS